MLGDGGDTPFRHELLVMVKKHSNLIGKTIVEVQDASDIEMDPRFWHDVMDLYFVRGKESRGRQDDDLVFFVRKVSSQGYDFKEYVEDDSPYFVRRWTPKLESLVGEYNADVDWRRSFYLNLIAHTTFSVTVAICSHQDLQNHQSQQNIPLSPIYKVVKTVYASPSRINFHLDSKKEVETTPAYPDICFAVDDFDSTFDAVVLTDTDHCYCVLLNAHDGAAFPNEKDVKDCSPNDTSLRIDTSFEMTKKTKLTLFSGFVSYQMVRDAYDAGKSRFGSIFSLSQYSEKTDRIYMKGPGGRGEVEVAVSGVADHSQGDTGPFSPIASKKGFGIGSIFRNAASVASVAAKQAYAATAAGTSYNEEMVPLKCCLMSISLPWEHIAYDLLFKHHGRLGALIQIDEAIDSYNGQGNLTGLRWGTDKNLSMKLLKKRILTRINAPMVMMQSLKEAGIFSSIISAPKHSGEAKEQILNIVESSNNSFMDANGKIFSENDSKSSDFHVNSRRVLEIRDQFSHSAIPSLSLHRA